MSLVHEQQRLEQLGTPWLDVNSCLVLEQCSDPRARAFHQHGDEVLKGLRFASEAGMEGSSRCNAPP